MTTLVNVNYQGKSQTIAIYPGLVPEELSSVLQAVFGFSGNVVGILAQVSSNVRVGIRERGTEWADGIDSNLPPLNFP
jgi:hypothetical protein